MDTLKYLVASLAAFGMLAAASSASALTIQSLSHDALHRAFQSAGGRAVELLPVTGSRNVAVVDSTATVRERLLRTGDRASLVRLTDHHPSSATSSFAPVQVRRRGSRTGAIVGAALGGLAGFYMMVALAEKQCGVSCSDEQFLMGVSLVGMPIAGAIVGYYLPGP